jgi:hypothetical protein
MRDLKGPAPQREPEHQKRAYDQAGMLSASRRRRNAKCCAVEGLEVCNSSAEPQYSYTHGCVKLTVGGCLALPPPPPLAPRPLCWGAPRSTVVCRTSHRCMFSLLQQGNTTSGRRLRCRSRSRRSRHRTGVQKCCVRQQLWGESALPNES